MPDDVCARLAGQRVLVTGARGFLGRYVVSAAEEAGAVPLTPSRAQLDLTDQRLTEAYMREERPQAIVHLAAECGGIGANVENPGRYLYANALMGLILLEAARQVSVDKFVFISTTCAYPQDAPIPLDETMLWDGRPAKATGPYGMAKRLLHEAIDGYQRQYGLSGVVLVPANLYGPGDHFEDSRSHVVPALIKRYVEATDENLDAVVNWGTGRPTREFLHARDAARGIILALARHCDPHPVNLGTGVETSISELATQIARAAGYEGRLEWDTTKPDGQPRRSLKVERARGFGFESTTTLADGIDETVQWYREFIR